MLYMNEKVSEERTGKARTSVPNKKKEIYEERRIIVFLDRFSVGCPAFILHGANATNPAAVSLEYCPKNR